MKEISRRYERRWKPHSSQPDITGEKLPKDSYFESSEKAHGRHEIRKIRALDVEQRLSVGGEWAGLRSIVMVDSERTLNGHTSSEKRYFISSRIAGAKALATSIRDHWGIENQQHWTLDMAFNEDRSRIRKGKAPDNFALLRRIALNLVKAEKTAKGGVKRRRFRAALLPTYLEKILLCAA